MIMTMLGRIAALEERTLRRMEGDGELRIEGGGGKDLKYSREGEVST